MAEYSPVYAQFGGHDAYLDLLYGKNRQGLNAPSNRQGAAGAAGTGRYGLPAEWYGAGGKLDPEAIFGSSVADYRKQQQEAKAANEARLGELRTGWAGMESMVSGLGQQEAADIRSAYDNAYAKEHQRLSAQGMGRTSLGSQVRLATEREKTADLARLNERTTQQRLGVTQGKLGMIERVQDEYPQMDQAALLGMQLGQSQGGAAGAGSRYAMLGTVGAGGARTPSNPNPQSRNQAPGAVGRTPPPLGEMPGPEFALPTDPGRPNIGPVASQPDYGIWNDATREQLYDPNYAPKKKRRYGQIGNDMDNPGYAFD